MCRKNTQLLQKGWVKADPERYAKFLLRHANYRKMKKLEKEEKEAQPPEQ